MLPRVLEPEVMDTAEEAADYDAMDHAAVNAAFCEDLLGEAPSSLASTLDVGTGTALIPVELCRRIDGARVVGIDLAGEMLAVGRRNVRDAKLDDRITLESRDAKATGLETNRFATVISNSLVHHVEDTVALFGEMRRLVAPGGLLFVRDLLRPDDEETLGALVDRYAACPAGLDAAAEARALRQRALFAASLRAALTIDEILAAATTAGLVGARVARSSDRHFTLVWTAR